MEEERQEIKKEESEAIEATEEAEAEEVVFEEPKGITGKLYYIAQVLRAIRQEEKDPDKVREYFEEIHQELTDMSDEIREMMEELYSDELPEKVADLTREIDELFDEASSLHIDAVEMMVEYMQTAQDDLIDKAMETLKKAGMLLEQASMLSGVFSEKQRGPQAGMAVNLNMEL